MRQAENLTDAFIDRLLSVKDRISSPDLHQARLCLLDFSGTALAGQRMCAEKLRGYLGFWDDSKTFVSAHPSPVNPALTAFLLSYAAHSTEMDDGERIGMVHPGTVVIPAILALTQIRKLSDLDLLTGIIVGYEATIVLARGMQPALKKRGFHATGVCGCIGAAMACAVAMYYTRDQMMIALSAAATSASGLLELITGDSELKAFNAANASSSALFAVATGLTNTKYPDDVLGGGRGLIQNFCSDTNSISAISETTNQLLIHSIYRKPYAACRHCHPAIDGALQLREKISNGSVEVTAITVETYDLAIHGHDHHVVESGASAKMSIPFSVAVALQTGKAGLEEFSEAQVTSMEIAKLMQKIMVVEDPELSRKVPLERAARITITSRTGDQFEAFISLPRGEPENPMSEAELRTKFHDLAEYSGLNQGDIEHLAMLVTSGSMPADSLVNNIINLMTTTKTENLQGGEK